MSSQDQNLKIVLTGGGTAGHVMPHIALLPYFKQNNLTPIYIGSKGIEKTLIEKQGVPFYQIQVGKLRRYFSIENLTDIFRLIIGLFQSFFLLVKIRPHIVYSKGGFVSVPVAIAAKLLNIPVVTHESDLTPGLANKIIAKFSTLILYSFPDTAPYLHGKAAKLVGIPVRQDLLAGDAARGKAISGFDPQSQLPTILVMGGSLGAQRINDALAKALPELSQHFQIIHITGKGKAISPAVGQKNYKNFEFLNEELKDVMAAADLIISRSGANSIFEFLRLAKPMILIPLEIGSRGDQVDNAECFEKHGLALVLREKELNEHSLLAAIHKLRSKQQLVKSHEFPENPEKLIMDSLQTCLRNK
ncbi:MAG: undecaprenyldiphospho-muramoylpentapeptide beta-N-acetylglucosaminyltransferase [Oligoflexus sp.]